MTGVREDGLDARRIRFAHGGRILCDDMHITAPGGSVTALLGPNGSGKSTLLRLIAGTLRGEVETLALDGASLPSMRRRERAQRVALVEQEWSTAEGMTGRDIVGLGLLPHRGWLSFEGRRRMPSPPMRLSAARGRSSSRSAMPRPCPAANANG